MPDCVSVHDILWFQEELSSATQTGPVHSCCCVYTVNGHWICKLICGHENILDMIWNNPDNYGGLVTENNVSASLIITKYTKEIESKALK